MSMQESPRVKRINELCAPRYRHGITGRTYRLIDEVDGICHLEPIDRRVMHVTRAILDDEGSVWSKAT